MATLTKLARVLWLTGCLGDIDIINTLSTINNNWLFSSMFDSGWKFGSLLNFLLLNLSFLLLLIHWVTSFRTFSRQKDETEGDLASEEGKEDLTSEEGEGST